MIKLPSKDEVKNLMVKASAESIKEKTGEPPTEAEIDSIKEYYNGSGGDFIESNLKSLESKCEQVEQESVAIPDDMASIPAELVLPDDLAVGSATTVPNPASVVKKFAQKMNEVKSRILAVLVIIGEIYQICRLLHIPVPGPIESANKILSSKKAEASDMKAPNVEQGTSNL